jgi:hypothetical protein
MDVGGEVRKGKKRRGGLFARKIKHETAPSEKPSLHPGPRTLPAMNGLSIALRNMYLTQVLPAVENHMYRGMKLVPVKGKMVFGIYHPTSPTRNISHVWKSRFVYLLILSPNRDPARDVLKINSMMGLCT